MIWSLGIGTFVRKWPGLTRRDRTGRQSAATLSKDTARERMVTMVDRMGCQVSVEVLDFVCESAGQVGRRRCDAHDPTAHNIATYIYIFLSIE